jgi:hypothetical protein
MSPVWQLQVVVAEGQPGPAQHVVPGNAPGSHAVGGDGAAPDEGSAVHEHPSHPAAQVTEREGGVELQAMGWSAIAASNAPSAGGTKRPPPSSMRLIVAGRQIVAECGPTTLHSAAR